jgi:putative MATE family efflux protein
MGTEKVFRLLLRYAANTLAALLFHSCYTLTDALFVSWGVGSSAMGGVSAAFPFVIIQAAIAAVLGGGAASIISRKLGENKRAEAGSTAFNALLCFWISAIGVSALGLIFLDPMIRALGTPEELYPYARDYLRIIIAGNVFSTGFSAIIRAEGRVRYALLIWVIPISVNLALDAVFILGFGWGVRGSAVATVIGQFTSFCMAILFFTRFSRLDFHRARLRVGEAGLILATGFPVLIHQGGAALTLALTNNILKNLGGGSAVVAYAYAGRILTFVIMPFTAITQALAPVAGYNFGAEKPGRVAEALVFSLLLSAGYALFTMVIVFLFPSQILSLMTADRNAIALGIKILRVQAVGLPFTPAAMIAGALWQSQGRRVLSAFMYSLSALFLLPTILAAAASGSLDAVFWAPPLAGFCSTLAALAALFHWNRRYLRQVC